MTTTPTGPRPSDNRPLALVTGASTGIGKALAAECARHGHPLVLASRNAAALRAVAGELESQFGVTTHIIPADLNDPESPSRLVQQLEARRLEIGILVNNAGNGVYGPFLSTDRKTELATIQLNTAALTDLTKLIVPGMVARGWGRVLNVASTAAFQPGPLMAVYYATKAYVLSFSQALHHELRGTGVSVTVLCPGPTRTEFQERAGMNKMVLTSGPMMASAESVARAGYAAMMRGKAVITPGVLNKLLAFGNRLVPRRIPVEIVHQMQKRRG